MSSYNKWIGEAGEYAIIHQLMLIGSIGISKNNMGQ